MTSVQPFAILHLTHEAIRVGLEEIEQLSIDLNDNATDRCLALYDQTTRIIFLHSAQEDMALYPLVHQKRPGIAEPFTTAHLHEAANFNNLRMSLERARADAPARQKAAEALRVWLASHRQHLLEEESVLLPLLPQLFDEVESVAAIRKFVSLGLDAYFGSQLPWVLQRLAPEQRVHYLDILKACNPESPDRLAERLKLLISPEELSRLFGSS